MVLTTYEAGQGCFSPDWQHSDSCHGCLCFGAKLVSYARYPLRRCPISRSDLLLVGRCTSYPPCLIHAYLAQFISSYSAGLPVPQEFQEWLSFSYSCAAPVDRPALSLGSLVSKFVDLSAYMQNYSPVDGLPGTTAKLQEMISLEHDLEQWGEERGGQWNYETRKGPGLPSKAVFQGEYHLYYDMWFARMWSHYRWARMLLNQLILNCLDRCPISSSALVSTKEPDQRAQLVRQLARETLVSAPSHWRHPSLSDQTLLFVEKPGGAGTGSGGIPVLVFHLRAAGCAPGVPTEYFDWAYGFLECIWGHMGMFHAKAVMDSMAAYGDATQRVGVDEGLVPPA